MNPADMPPGMMSEFNRLDADVRAAVFWLATCDGFKIMKHVSVATLKAVYADLVAAGQYQPEVSDGERNEGTGPGVAEHRESG